MCFQGKNKKKETGRLGKKVNKRKKEKANIKRKTFDLLLVFQHKLRKCSFGKQRVGQTLGPTDDMVGSSEPVTCWAVKGLFGFNFLGLLV